MSDILSDRSEFTVTEPDFPFTISANDFQNVVVRFAPFGMGEVSGKLQIVSNAQNLDLQSGELLGDTEIGIRGMGLEPLLGDITGNAEVDVLDLLAMIDIILGNAIPTEQQMWAADLIEDGVVNILDAISLANLIVGGTAKPTLTNEVVSYFESLSSKLSVVEHNRLMEMLKNAEVPVPTGYSLAQNYPNPFNPETEIAFGIPEDAIVVLKVYNVLGQEVAELVNTHLEAGHHFIKWNGENFSSGVYYYRLKVNEYTATKRMVLMK